ncbi:MAG: hypothetical protein IPH24_17730 [Crocinitomicaceae bacterium]|nr:hypothetical protein [Crocinitomicaceae bacterium]
MNTLIQLASEESGSSSTPDSSIRSLRIFASHKSIFDKETNTFTNFLLVIGYSGGGCQEECFYKIDGSNLEKSTVWISTSAGDSFYQFSFKYQKIVELETEMNQFDRQIQSEFLESINKYLSYDEVLDYYFYDYRNPIVNSGFMITDKFPIRVLKFLKNVYWPFSTNW